MSNTPEEIAVLLSLGLPAFKYKKGDRVWHIQSDTTTKMLPCPDCLDTRKWHVTTPAGTEMTMACQRCNDRMSHDARIPSLKYHVTVYSVRPLTIGQLNNQSHNHAKDRSYMCFETGIGSGSVYDEEQFFEDEEVARDMARIKTEEAEAKKLESPQMLHAQHFSDILVDRAAWMATFSQIYDAWTRAREYRKALEDMIEISNSGSPKCDYDWTSKFSKEDVEAIEELLDDKYKYSDLTKYHKDRNAIELLECVVTGLLTDPAHLDTELLEKIRDMFPTPPQRRE